MRYVEKSIPDRLRPGLPTTASGDARQGADGKRNEIGIVVWACHEERPGIRMKKGDGNGATAKEEKREAKEKIFGCSEGSYGESWCKGEGP